MGIIIIIIIIIMISSTAPPSASVPAGQQERWWGCCACECTGTWTLLSHPTPLVTDHERAVPVCRTARKMMRLLCLCVHESRRTFLSHPTPLATDHDRAVAVSVREQERWWVAVPVCAQEHERFFPTPPHRTPQRTMMKVQWLFPEWEMMRVRKWVTFCSLSAQESEGA